MKLNVGQNKREPRKLLISEVYLDLLLSRIKASCGKPN